MTPLKINFNSELQQLQLSYANGESHSLSSEFLRVHSPSAEVRGHGKGQEVLQFGKKEVRIKNLVKTGNYAIQIVFNDGHDTGIYSWDYLYQLGTDKEQFWNDYLARLNDAGKHRDANVQVVQLMDPSVK
jgi:DUF971 family protein